MNLSNFTINLQPEIGKICLSHEQLLSFLKDTCRIAGIDKPLLFIGLAIFLDLIECYSRDYLLNEKILFKSRFYILSTTDILVIISTAKSFCLIMSVLFLYLGVKIWTG